MDESSCIKLKTMFLRNTCRTFSVSDSLGGAERKKKNKTVVEEPRSVYLNHYSDIGSLSMKNEEAETSERLREMNLKSNLIRQYYAKNKRDHKKAPPSSNPIDSRINHRIADGCGVSDSCTYATVNDESGETCITHNQSSDMTIVLHSDNVSSDLSSTNVTNIKHRPGGVMVKLNYVSPDEIEKQGKDAVISNDFGSKSLKSDDQSRDSEKSPSNETRKKKKVFRKKRGSPVRKMEGSSDESDSKVLKGNSSASLRNDINNLSSESDSSKLTTKETFLKERLKQRKNKDSHAFGHGHSKEISSERPRSRMDSYNLHNSRFSSACQRNNLDSKSVFSEKRSSASVQNCIDFIQRGFEDKNAVIDMAIENVECNEHINFNSKEESELQCDDSQRESTSAGFDLKIRSINPEKVNSTDGSLDVDPIKEEGNSINECTKDAKENCSLTERNSKNSPETHLLATLSTMDYSKKFQDAEHLRAKCSKDRSKEEFQGLPIESLCRNKVSGVGSDQTTLWMSRTSSDKEDHKFEQSDALKCISSESSGGLLNGSSVAATETELDNKSNYSQELNNKADENRSIRTEKSTNGQFLIKECWQFPETAGEEGNSCDSDSGNISVKDLSLLSASFPAKLWRDWQERNEVSFHG